MNTQVTWNGKLLNFNEKIIEINKGKTQLRKGQFEQVRGMFEGDLEIKGNANGTLPVPMKAT